MWWASVNGGVDMLGVCIGPWVHGDRLLHGICRQFRLGEAVVSVYMCIARVWRVTRDHVSVKCIIVCTGGQVYVCPQVASVSVYLYQSVSVNSCDAPTKIAVYT